ncbi:hypothetical protein [Delftia acidovorans]|uniref:hypothetical protein n=1 Tax=Delftia acidovorans TaxID=80866 RepID=UPI001EDE73E2|nr:hypothetical protein [Delftia acidovorans]MCG3784820.1 hypothetical protein [Delftia acidovorans]
MNTEYSSFKKFRERQKRQLASWLDRLYINEFSLLEKHRLFVEENFFSDMAQLKSDLDEDLSGMDPADAESYSEFLGEKRHMLTEVFPSLQWQAQFLVVYATFEANLNALCNVVRRRLNSRILLKDLSGSTFEKAQKYLEKVGELNIDSLKGEEFLRAKQLGDVRNFLAHSQGLVDKEKDKKFFNIFSNIPGLKLVPIFENEEVTEHNLQLSSEFVRYAIDNLRILLHKISILEREWPKIC